MCCKLKFQDFKYFKPEDLNMFVTTINTGSIGSRSHVDMHVEENEEELRVVLPVPPQAAHTTTRKVAGLGPAMGATYAAGMLHRMALHGQTDGMK